MVEHLTFNQMAAGSIPAGLALESREAAAVAGRKKAIFALTATLCLPRRDQAHSGRKTDAPPLSVAGGNAIDWAQSQV